MSDVVERFLRYVQIDSPSNPQNADHVPSNPQELHMANALGDDLRSIGCDDVVVDEHAYVTAGLSASAGAGGLPALGLIAHLDSSSDAPATSVRPHIVHYEGGDLVCGMHDGKRVSVSPSQLPALKKLVGQDIICSDGSTLLSADDKAGVAEICSLAARLKAQPQLAHPALKIAFVPDEEIGHGAALLDLERFGAAWAYTVDGEALGEFNWETFNASTASVCIRGIATHPGSAKGAMVNAITVAAEFQALVPAAERPESTEGREGFFHPMQIRGDVSHVQLNYILRDHDEALLARREGQLRSIAAFLNERHGANTVQVTIKEGYRNMAEVIKTKPFLVDYALEAHREAGVEPVVRPVRGGTDGSVLSFRGLPCPNIATGGYNFHSVREFIPVTSLEKTVDILEKLVAKFAAKPL